MKAVVLFTVLLMLMGLNAPWSVAGDLKAPLELESTSVLPKGVFNPRFKSVFAPSDSKLNGLGKRVPLGDALNKSVSFQDIVDARDDASDKASILSLMGSDILTSDIAGETTGEVNAYGNVFIPVLAYGITPQWTTALAVPIVNIDISVKNGFVKTTKGEELINRGANSSSPYNAEKAANDLANALSDQLEDKGYNKLRSRNFTAVGDAKIINKYLLHEDSKNVFTAKADLTIPTGKAPDANELVDASTGDGQWDVGGTLIYERKNIFPSLGMNLYGSYTAQLPDTIEKRIPDEGDFLTRDKENVSRNLGDIMSVGTGFTYELPRQTGLTLGLGYGLQYASATSYEGTRYSQNRYRLLEETAPSQLLHTMTTGLSFSTVNWYRASQFALPMGAQLNYSRALAGRNISYGDLYFAELIFYF